MAIMFPGMMNQGYWAWGGDDIHDNVCISSSNRVYRSTHWVPLYLPGIF